MAEPFDSWAWGFCKYCRRYIELDADFKKPMHGEHHYSTSAGCTNMLAPREPDPPPQYGELPEYRRLYKVLNDEIKHCNDTDRGYG